MENITKTIENSKYSHKFLVENSEIYKMFNNLSQKAFQDGSIAKKYKELIALGISIVVNCEPCLFWHINQAFESGCTYEEILEVFEVAIEMGGGPAFARNQFNLKVLDAVYKRHNEK